MRLFKKKGKDDTEVEDDGIVVLKKTEPNMCGGTDAYQDTKAPKTIVSDDMVYFSLFSALGRMMGPDTEGPQIDSFYAFAAPVDAGTLMYLTKSYVPRRRGDVEESWAVVQGDVLPGLAKLTRELDLAKSNGFHSETHGLPENFGGRADIRYGSGEKIWFSNNQSPIVSPKVANAVVSYFEDAMGKGKVELPDVSRLSEIGFSEKRKDDGFTEAVLRFNADGTGTNSKKSRYSDPKVYESEKSVDADTVEAIKKTIIDTALLAQAGAPRSEYVSNREKTMEFVFDDGRTVKVEYGTDLPERLGRGFFEIELEMTTKH
ncbi:MAG: hypothetical protein IJ856_05350 [Candidatus Methanomethylophilaceae archaeon]|nr:hypothetical protein [Candidatus Methanomethylophilaceae archaeon]